MKNRLGKYLFLGSAAFVLAACNTSIQDSQDQGASQNNTQEQVETGEQESAGGTKAVALADYDVDDDEAWKKEPAYGQSIQLVSSTGCTAPINVAETMGFYEDEGLKVETVETPQTSIDAVGTGQAAIGIGLITPTLIPMINGVNAQYLGPAHTGCKALYVAADSDVESSADLDGAKIGIHGGLGESDHNVGLRFFQNAGVDTDSINWVSTDVSASPQAIANGELDGGIYDENMADPYVKDGTLKKIESTTTSEDFKDEVCCAYYVNKDFARENPITTKKLTRAIYRANAWAEEDSKSYIDYLYDQDFLTGDYDIGFNFIDKLNYHPSQDQMSATVKEITADYQELGIVDDSVDVNTLYEQLYAPVGLEISDFTEGA